jgi:hypothetical protein
VKEIGFYHCFPEIELCLLHIIFASDYSESSHSRTLRLDRRSFATRCSAVACRNDLIDQSPCGRVA